MNSAQIEPIQIESNIFYLDPRWENGSGVSGIYIIVGDGITLIETGTALIVPYIFEAVRHIGFKKNEIKRAVLTHIHLDHAGGTGWLVRQLPHLEVYVHERGLNHLKDPSRLIESAKTVYGSLKAIYDMHGDIDPIPGENLHPISNRQLDVGSEIVLDVFDAPGHAGHHLCIYEPGSGCLFSGEALGHYRPEFSRLQPAVAPPAFDLEASLETIEKIRELSPRTICFSQYGYSRDPIPFIDEAVRQLHLYHDLLLPMFKANLDMVIIQKRVVEYLSKTKDPSGQLSGSMLISVLRGYQTYFKRRGKIA